MALKDSYSIVAGSGSGIQVSYRGFSTTTPTHISTSFGTINGGGSAVTAFNVTNSLHGAFTYSNPGGYGLEFYTIGPTSESYYDYITLDGNTYNKVDSSTTYPSYYHTRRVWSVGYSNIHLTSGSTYTLEVHEAGTAPTAHTSLGITSGSTEAASTSVSFNPTGGSLGNPAGTVNYNRTATDITPPGPSTGWTSSNFILNNSRGTTYRYWSRIQNEVGSAIKYEDFAVPYLAPAEPSTSYPSSIGVSAVSFTFSYGSPTVLSSNHSLLLQYNNSGTWTNITPTFLSSSTGSVTVSGAALPAVGGSKNYRVLVSRDFVVGGDALYDTVESFTVTKEGYTAPDTSITVNKNTPLFNSSSFQVKLTSTTNTTSYEIRSGSYSGTVLKTITNQDGVWVTVNNQPSTSGTTYYVTAFVSTANGGDESRSNVTTFTVTRSSEVNPDTAITQSPSGGITTSNNTFTKSITNANSNSVTDYRLLRTTGTDIVYDTYIGTATSFTLTGDMPSSGDWTYVIQARVPTANNGDDVWVNAGSSFTVTKSSSGSSSGGTTYDKYGSTTDITQNVFNDDLINVYYDVQGADTNKSWFLSNSGCSATPLAGFFYSGHPVGSTFMSYLNNFSGSSYSAEFFVEDTSKFTISGTVTDPYGVTNISFSSKTVTPGNGTATTESVAQTFDTFREGETLDYSVTGGELYNGSAWGTSGTVADGASIKLRGITPAVYSGNKTVTVTFSKNSVTKHTESFVIYTPDLTAPTDITFVNDGDSSATEQVTVTASGGTSGTIKVSNDGTNWYANGTKFDHTRGTGVTYYARREGVNSLTSSNYTEPHAVSCITPTNLTFVNDGDASATEEVTVTASGGYGGTLEVSSDGTNWYANGTKFDQSRNTSVTYYARREATYSSGNYTEAHSVGYLAPLAYSYTVSGSNPLNYSDTGFNVTVSGADADHTYRVLHDGANAGTRTTDGNIAVQSSELPLPGGQKTYTVQAVRAESIGGSGAYVTKSTFIRSVRPSTPSVSPSVAATESSTTNVTVSASSTGAAEYRFSNDGTNYTAWGTSSSYVFENQSRGTAYTYYVQSRSAVAESLVGSSTTTVPYLAPDTSVSIPSTAYTVGSNTTTQDIVITGVGNNETVRITGEDSVTAAAKGNATLTVDTPTSGSVGTYQIEIQRDTASGGNGTTWYNTNKSFTITRGSNATPVIDLFIPAPSSTVGEETVTLSTTGITDSDGTISTITITQVSGTNVTLADVTTTGTGTGSATASTTFTSPNGSGSLVFRVTVTDDDGGTSSKDVLVTTSESSVVLPPADGVHGLEIYGPNNELYLSVTDKLVIFLDNPVGYLLQNIQSKTITLTGNPTHVIWLNAPAALTLASLNFTLNGNILTIARASASTVSIPYELLVLGE